MFNDFIKPVLVLTFICLVISGMLAAVNDITQPIIEQAAYQRTIEARKEIIDTDEFIRLSLEGLPESIKAAYGTKNNAGYIFTVVSFGYGGNIELLCGISFDGKIIRTVVLNHSETSGLGTIVFDKADAYIGKDIRLEGIDAITGSTITSNAYKKGITDAFIAFEIIKGKPQ